MRFVFCHIRFHQQIVSWANAESGCGGTRTAGRIGTQRSGDASPDLVAGPNGGAVHLRGAHHRRPEGLVQLDVLDLYFVCLALPVDLADGRNPVVFA